MLPHSHPMPQPGLLLPKRRAAVAVAVMLLAPFASASDHKSAPPPKPAVEYAAYDTHPAEHVTIAAEPCDDARQCPFFRLEYVQHGLLPVRVIVSNDSDQALSLEDARIHLIPENGERVEAATDEDINRRLFTLHSTQPTHIPLTPIKIHHAPIDKKVTDDLNDFGFQSTTVQAHSTAAGYVFYDVRDLGDPALPHSELMVKMVHTLDGKKELFAFNVSFDKWLAANPNAASNRPHH